MDDAKLAMTLARARIGAGAAAVLAPALAARVMGGRSATEGITPMLMRMLGGRDIALGLGTVIALDRGVPVRGWLEGSALCDVVDLLGGVLARDRLSPVALRATVGLAAGSALAGAFLARRLDPHPPAQPGQPEAVATGHPEA